MYTINPNLDLVQVQNSLNQQQQAKNSAFAQALLSGKGDALSEALGRSTPSTPKLKFDVDATGIWDGLAGGLGNAVNNALQMKAYNQQREQQQALFDLAQARELAVAQEKQRNLNMGNEAIGILMNPQAPPEQRLQAFQNMNIATGGKFSQDLAGQFGKQQVDLMGINPRVQAESQAKFTATKDMADMIQRDIKEKFGVDIYSPDIAKAQLPANVRNRLSQLGIDNPEDYLSDVERFSRASSAKSQATMDNIEAQTLPTQKKQEIQGTALELKIKEVDAQYAEALKQIDKLTGESRIEEANELKLRLGEGRKRYDQAVASYDNLTPGQIKLFNSQMKSLNLPYELPEKKDNKLTPIKYKGKVTGFTDSEGHVYDKDGNPKG